MSIVLRPHQPLRRRRNERSTSIYWLVDARTGVPFYCGKTVLPLHVRLTQHKYEAAHGNRRVHVKVRECSEHVRIRAMEVVPADGDWGAREKRWIFILRWMNPNTCNTADGGAGVPGRIISETTRQKLITANVGRKHTPEARAKVSAFLTGRKWSQASIEKMRATKIGQVRSAEHCANIGKAKKGKPGKPWTPTVRTKIMEARKRRIYKPHSPEARAKISASLKAWYAAQ